LEGRGDGTFFAREDVIRKFERLPAVRAAA
jgi:hypothetical protein